MKGKGGGGREGGREREGEGGKEEKGGGEREGGKGRGRGGRTLLEVRLAMLSFNLETATKLLLQLIYLQTHTRSRNNGSQTNNNIQTIIHNMLQLYIPNETENVIYSSISRDESPFLSVFSSHNNCAIL